MTIKLQSNRICKGELALVKSAYWRKWSRLLFMANGTYVEVDLTPIDGNIRLNWEKIRSINIRRHCTAPAENDRRYLAVQKNSIQYNIVRAEMAKGPLSDDEIETLLTTDFLPMIDWDLHRKYNNGGCFLADCGKPVEV